MRPGDKVSTEMGLKIISYGCLDLEEGDGHWRESNPFIGSRYNTLNYRVVFQPYGTRSSRINEPISFKSRVEKLNLSFDKTKEVEK